jgi:hypothetical protein
MRIATLLLVSSFLLAGCTGGARLQDPRTGAHIDCGTETIDLNPWSQTDACVAEHIAQGWTIEERH